MRQSTLFTKTRKEAPKDEVSKNAILLTRAGFIHKEMAGVYSYLPLGRRVLSKIENIIREEMNRIGGQEISMATLHPSENWKKTGGWDSIDVLFKIQSRTEKEYALGQSEEEIVTPIVAEHVISYKDLPLAVYQIGQKYRDELRAKSGIMRGREFGMKDMYSFHESQEDFERFYAITKEAYLLIYARCGLDAKVTEASGGSFSDKLSYEFMAISDAGEDSIVYCQSCRHCANIEVSKEKAGNKCSHCGKGNLIAANAVEVGNVFDLGKKYPLVFNFTYKDKEGNSQTPIVGCYGIGTTRLMGTIAEVLSDDKGLIWPKEIAPFQVHLLSLSEKAENFAEEIYKTLVSQGIEVLFDDRDLRAGEKFADSDLIGIPTRVIIGEKSLESKMIEVKDRDTGKSRELTIEDLIQEIKGQ
jgi:prolyl-tRNA synthetase